MPLTPPQRAALSRVCLLPEETAHPALGSLLHGGASLVLSINAGFE